MVGCRLYISKKVQAGGLTVEKWQIRVRICQADCIAEKTTQNELQTHTN